MSTPSRMTPDTAAAIEQACICVAVQRAARVIGREFDSVFRAVGLSNWQFTLLTTLALGNPPTMRELADELALDKSTLTANVKLLEKRGLITIEPDSQDRRARRVRLTGPGRSLLDDTIPLWEQAQAACLARLDIAEAASLRQTLATLSSRTHE
ncbi:MULTISPECIES: MarR family winged helix-turn-helix transcriptional regulator [unclassified Methylobacterium]|uniref:MarR family winged helix-turn-helix transcriptional regulator n=2 Tax=Bacteria TaxID=2 RepID=UPI003701799A